MNFIELLFKILTRFVPIGGVEYGKLKEEGTDWYNSINVENENVNPLLAKFKVFSENWYSKVMYAIMYIVLSREITLYMNPQIDNKGDNEEDED